MVSLLDRRFGGEAWDKNRRPRDPLDDLMGTILSQNTTDENRDRAYDALRMKYPSWEEVRKARQESVKAQIRVAGLANQKGPNMQGFLRSLKKDRGDLSLEFLKDMPVDEAIQLLVGHKGVGLKTAYIVLAFSCGKDLCAVDTHVHRILRRVGIIRDKCTRDKAHLELAPLIPKGKARSFHANLIDFGKSICTARKPDCPSCPIAQYCTYSSQVN